VPNWISVVSNN